MTLSEAIAQRAASSGMTTAQAISYRAGALEARLIIQTATEDVLLRINSSKGTAKNGR